MNDISPDTIFGGALSDPRLREVMDDIEHLKEEALQTREGLDYLKRQRYFHLSVFNEEINIAKLPGVFIRASKTQDKFTIYTFEHCVVITPGEMTFEEIGNWSRALNSMREVFDSEHVRQWAKVGIESSELETAWAEATRRGLNAGLPPSQAAQEKLTRVKAMLGESGTRSSPGLKYSSD